MKSPLRIALIGCGNHAWIDHAVPLTHFARRHPGSIERVACCDPNEAATARFVGPSGFAKTYADFERMLDVEKPDAVVSVLPVPLVARVGKVLLERGVPCVIEKPLGPDLESARSLAACARKTGTKHMVSFNRRFNPFLRKGWDWFRERSAVRRIHASMLRHARRESDFLWTTGSHALDTIAFLGGSIAEVRSAATRGGSSWFDLDLSFASGASGRCVIAPTAGHVEESYEILGEEHMVRIVIGSGETVSVTGWAGGKIELDLKSGPDIPREFRTGAWEETCHFLESLLREEPMGPSCEEILPRMEILDRAGRDAAGPEGSRR